jgi:hypothetical protein
VIDIYHMTPEQTIEMIERLRREVGWSRLDLLRKIYKWHWVLRPMKLDAALERVKSKGLLEKLWWYLVDKAPFKIRLDNLGDRHGCVMIYCSSQILAKHDQTIAGSRWECPSDMDIAYAMPPDSPDLLEELKKEGYEIDDSQYSPPDPLVCAICKAPFNNEEKCLCVERTTP